MGNFFFKIITSKRFQTQKRTYIIALFILIGGTEALNFDWIMHPVYDLTPFLFVVFVSLILSWKMNELKNERELLQHDNSIVLPGFYQLDKKDIDIVDSIKQKISENLKRLDEIKLIYPVLFVLNLIFGSYAGLCVSYAVITKRCVC